MEIIAIARAVSGTLPKVTRGKWVFLDISEPPEKVFEKVGEPDVLIHLAWEGLQNYMSLHHYEFELPSHYILLKKLIQQGLKNLVITGTCFEYGRKSGPMSPYFETEPANPYGFAKDALRRQLEFLQSQNSFNLTWARLFYLYGNFPYVPALY